MLFALRHPVLLVGLILGFVVGCGLRAVAQRRLAAPRGGRAGRGRLRVAGAGRSGGAARIGGSGWNRGSGWAQVLDPYGTVAAVIAGIGWGARVPVRSGRGGRASLPLLAALVVHGVLAAAGFAGYVAVGGSRDLVHALSVFDVVRGSVAIPGVAQQILLGFAVENLGCGLLALAPIPPLELGVLLWSRLPRSPGARRLAYRLLDEAWGVALVLVGLLLPLAGQTPVLLALVDIVADPLLGRV